MFKIILENNFYLLLTLLLTLFILTVFINCTGYIFKWLMSIINLEKIPKPIPSKPKSKPKPIPPPKPPKPSIPNFKDVFKPCYAQYSKPKFIPKATSGFFVEQEFTGEFDLSIAGMIMSNSGKINLNITAFDVTDHERFPILTTTDFQLEEDISFFSFDTERVSIHVGGIYLRQWMQMPTIFTSELFFPKKGKREIEFVLRILDKNKEIDYVTYTIEYHNQIEGYFDEIDLFSRTKIKIGLSINSFNRMQNHSEREKFKKLLIEEYQRWNQIAGHRDAEKRRQAKNMVQYIAKIKKEYL